MKADLMAGDVFCAHGNMHAVSAFIRFAERVHSRDDVAHYGHSGIIASRDGDTIETGWTVRNGHIDEYVGSRVIIARPTMRLETLEPINQAEKLRALTTIRTDDMGRWYPLWRLPMHLIPPLAKYLGTGRNLVCSERTAKYLRMIGARPWPYTGVNPDMLADEWISWKNFDVIFEGVWSNEFEQN